MAEASRFFLGANSGRGFQSLFPAFCRDEKFYDLMVLKGGPGCGKSTFMRIIGAAMEERGETVEYIHCSGDPDSLDGVHIPRIRTAILDGTSPHVVEPRYPPAVDRYINLGRFYNVAAAKEEREAVCRLGEACSKAYRSAYRALGAARAMEEEIRTLLCDGFDRDRLAQRAEGIISRELRGRGGGGAEKLRYLGSVTHKGPVWCFDSVVSLCPKVYQLQDSYGLAAPMLEQIRREARCRKFQTIVCPDPEWEGAVQHMLLPELGLAFVTSREGMRFESPAYRRIRIDAMLDESGGRECRARLRFLRRLESLLQEEGIAALRSAKAAHDELEAVFRPTVDFSGVEELAQLELARISRY